jgi:hypothetical protein
LIGAGQLPENAPKFPEILSDGYHCFFLRIDKPEAAVYYMATQNISHM